MVKNCELKQTFNDEKFNAEIFAIFFVSNFAS